jgi:hypothetical protein
MSLIASLMPLILDVYEQTDTQDINTGAIKKEWSYIRTVPCSAKGLISNSSSSRSGDRQVIDSTYSDKQVLEIRTVDKISYREKITNVRDMNGNVIWKEMDYPTDTPTVFELVSSTPVTDPFGSILAYNSVAKRSENQAIGI